MQWGCVRLRSNNENKKQTVTLKRNDSLRVHNMTHEPPLQPTGRLLDTLVLDCEPVGGIWCTVIIRIMAPMDRLYLALCRSRPADCLDDLDLGSKADWPIRPNYLVTSTNEAARRLPPDLFGFKNRNAIECNVMPNVKGCGPYKLSITFKFCITKHCYTKWSIAGWDSNSVPALVVGNFLS